MSLEHEIAIRYSCAKCRNPEVYIKRIATTGTGLSRIFDIEHNVFIACSCTRCSYTELYNPELLEGKDNLGAVLDLLFG
ncbi:zinc ribbon domain-containing protein [Larkinella bovis]|uniref:Zinc ribbon domain-containing protein n=1 Tax=Larkinella bovis TaxID=683041 RepID=A0ABW0I8E9_9BACT